MQVSVEIPSTLERRLTVVIPVETIEEAFDKRILKWAKTAKVKGFRPGKVPLQYVKQWYGNAAREESLGEVIKSALNAAIDQEKLNPVSIPTVEPKAFIPGQPFEFVAVFEVLPVITQVTFELQTLEKHISTIEETDVDNVLQHLRQQQAVWQKVSRPAIEKDQVILDFRGSIDGVVFNGGEAHDYPVVLGSKTMIPGFEEGLIGIQVGEERVLDVTFPDNYFSAEFAGKAAQFTITAHSISEAILPAIDEVFIKKMGVKSGIADDFRAEVRRNLERELQRVIKAKLKNQVFDQLIQQNPLEIPKALIERESKRVHDELHPHHAGQAHNHTETEMATFNEAAKRNVALGMLVAYLIKKHNILPNRERVEQQIEYLASVYENPAEVVKWYTNNKKAKADVEMQVLEEQLIEKLLENVQVSEKMLSYSELISGKIK